MRIFELGFRRFDEWEWDIGISKSGLCIAIHGRSRIIDEM